MNLSKENIIRYICYITLGLLLLFSILSFTVWNAPSDQTTNYFKGLAVLGFITVVFVVAFKFNKDVRAILLNEGPSATVSPK